MGTCPWRAYWDFHPTPFGPWWSERLSWPLSERHNVLTHCLPNSTCFKSHWMKPQKPGIKINLCPLKLIPLTHFITWFWNAWCRKQWEPGVLGQVGAAPTCRSDPACLSGMGGKHSPMSTPLVLELLFFFFFFFRQGLPVAPSDQRSALGYFYPGMCHHTWESYFLTLLSILTCHNRPFLQFKTWAAS